MARKKIREYDSKRLIKEHLKRLTGIDLQIRSAQVFFSRTSYLNRSLFRSIHLDAIRVLLSCITNFEAFPCVSNLLYMICVSLWGLVGALLWAICLILRIEITFSLEFLVKIDRWSWWENYWCFFCNIGNRIDGLRWVGEQGSMAFVSEIGGEAGHAVREAWEEWFGGS